VKIDARDPVVDASLLACARCDVSQGDR